MEYLKEYQTRQMYELIGVGLIKANEIIMYDVEESDTFKNIDNVENAFEKMTPVKWWFYEDEDARAFAHVRLDFGEKGTFENFELSEPTLSHWSLYKRALDQFNVEIKKDSILHHGPMTMNEVKELIPSLDGRLWEQLKIIVLKSYSSYDEDYLRINQIYEKF